MQNYFVRSVWISVLIQSVTNLEQKRASLRRGNQLTETQTVALLIHKSRETVLRMKCRHVSCIAGIPAF
jgi:hypothetical protein